MTVALTKDRSRPAVRTVLDNGGCENRKLF